jgi:diaminobutyrate-2-oxoglutarate transaminase
MTDTFEKLESNVRSYCRKFPRVFVSGLNAVVSDESGRDYIDFLCGAGALNYGHNNAEIKHALMAYLDSNAIVHSLDLHTTAKREFLQRFDDVILQPRGYQYKMQFTGPTGTNSVEAALKLARKVTRRAPVVAFTNAFHGMSLGSLAVTARAQKRASAGTVLPDVVRMPFDGYLGRDVNSLDYIEAMLADPGSGIDEPAAFIVETLQAEGGLNVASNDWLVGLQEFARERGILLIVDDIQAGCGRTGTFFSFERAKIKPDIVCLSKSISGYGLPMSLVLIRPDLDIWDPGEHSGTFRGNNLAFVAASKALEFWANEKFEQEIANKSELLSAGLRWITRWRPEYDPEVKGLGLIQGIAWRGEHLAQAISAKAFDLGVITEVCGPSGNVLKVMPPLTIEADLLTEGLRRLATAVQLVIGIAHAIPKGNGERDAGCCAIVTADGPRRAEIATFGVPSSSIPEEDAPWTMS